MLGQYESMTVWLDEGVKRGTNGLHAPDLIQLGDCLDPKASLRGPGGRQNRFASRLQRSSRAYHQGRLTGRRDFQKVYPRSGRTISDSQTALALAIHSDLFSDDSQRQHGAERLAFLMTREKLKVATGFAGK
jgi:alpha-L-rhamnosidase